MPTGGKWTDPLTSILEKNVKQSICVAELGHLKHQGWIPGGGDVGYSLPWATFFYFLCLQKKKKRGVTQNKVDEIREVFFEIRI